MEWEAGNVQTSITALQDCQAENSSTVIGLWSAKPQTQWVKQSR